MSRGTSQIFNATLFTIAKSLIKEKAAKLLPAKNDPPLNLNVPNLYLPMPDLAPVSVQATTIHAQDGEH